MNKIILIVIPVLIITFGFNNTIKKDDIKEEATPIRIGDTIQKMEYNIIIRDSNKDKISYNTKILDSIYHYTDISKFDEFLINLKLDNETQDKYYLKKIIIYNKNKIIKTYNYQNIIDNREVDLKLSKDILNKIYKNNKLIGNIKIIIEK